MFVCIAGKNNIAIDVTEYILNLPLEFDIGVVFNKTETGKNSWQRSFKAYAESKGIKEYKLDEIYSIHDLVFISLEFDQIIKPERFLDARLFNIHFSLLPAYKGMYTSAIPILNNEEQVGVTFHRIDAGIDTGEVIDQISFNLGSMNCRELYLSYISYGTRLVINNIEDVLKGQEKSTAQEIKGSTYYSKKYINYSDLSIDLKQTARGIGNQVRAFNFREYQLPEINGYPIIDYKILDIRSFGRPGTICVDTKSQLMCVSIDYYIILFKDRLKELLVACKTNDIKTVEEICLVDAHINAQNDKGWSPLMVATYNNCKEIVYLLISLGADIFATNHNGTNLLMYAKEAYKHFNDNTLFKFYKTLGLSENQMDYYEHDLLFYLKQDGIRLEKLLD